MITNKCIQHSRFRKKIELQTLPSSKSDGQKITTNLSFFYSLALYNLLKRFLHGIANSNYIQIESSPRFFFQRTSASWKPSRASIVINQGFCSAKFGDVSLRYRYRCSPSSFTTLSVVVGAVGDGGNSVSSGDATASFLRHHILLVALLRLRGLIFMA